jgi:multidrug resistance efflux pump
MTASSPNSSRGGAAHAADAATTPTTPPSEAPTLPPATPTSNGREPPRSPSVGSGHGRARLPLRRLLLLALALVVVVGGVVVAYRWWRDSALYVSTDNAQVGGYMTQIGGLEAGRVAKVNVDLGDHVTQNQVVAQIDVPTTVSQTAAGTPNQQFTGTTDTLIDVKSPVDGIVVARNANPADVVPAGQSILTVVNPNELWVVANIGETSIRRVRPGQRVLVHVDNLNADFTGKVAAIVQASAQSFSPLPQQNLSGNYTKVTQLQPVKILLDQVDPRLAFGTSVEVQIEVGQ